MNPIAELNDRFRARAGLPILGRPDVPGIVVMTRDIASLPPAAHLAIWAKIRKFSDFGEDNDPWEERDFGVFKLGDLGKLFWKIDYYADETMHEGAEAPDDPERSFRVLTVMFADEW